MERLDPDKVLTILGQCKQGPVLPESALLVRQHGRSIAWLIPVTWDDADCREAVALLADWRRAAADAFPSQFPITLQGTQGWLKEQVLEVPDRVLFWVTDLDGARLGHLGLYRYEPGQRHIEIDNVVRGVPDALPGAMQCGLRTLLDWTFSRLDLNAVYLRVFSDNERALRLYDRCGFVETMRMPLTRLEEGDVVRWVEVDGSYREPVQRYFVTMRLVRQEWQANRKRNQAA
jgi:RimJ/RimL family protein N-acetyltransferase